MGCERSLRFHKVLESLQTQYDELLREVHTLTSGQNETFQCIHGINRLSRAGSDDKLGCTPVKSHRASNHVGHFESVKGLMSERGFDSLLGRKKKLKDQIKGSIKSVESGDDLYRKSGFPATIAKSSWFGFVSLAVVVLNAIWIAVDVDLRLDQSDVGPYIEPLSYHSLQSVFCSFFLFEFTIRCFAFEKRWEACKKLWYLTDAILTLAIVVETVVMPWVRSTKMQQQNDAHHDTIEIVDSGVLSGISSALRCLQVVRVSKFVLLLPGTKSLMTCVVVGLRGVSAAGMLVAAFTYGFAIILKILSEGSSVGDTHFRSFPQSLFTLVVLGVLPESSHFVLDIPDAPWYVIFAICIFFVIVQTAIMNLLIGLLCKVVENVAEAEKEARETCFLRAKLADVIAVVDSDWNGSLSKAEIFAILENPVAIESLNHVGIDVVALADSIDEMFEAAGVDEFGVDEFVEALGQYRATTQATVAVITDLRKIIFRRLTALEHNVIMAKSKQVCQGKTMSLTLKENTSDRAAIANISQMDVDV